MNKKLVSEVSKEGIIDVDITNYVLYNTIQY